MELKYKQKTHLITLNGFFPQIKTLRRKSAKIYHFFTKNTCKIIEYYDIKKYNPAQILDLNGFDYKRWL